LLTCQGRHGAESADAVAFRWPRIGRDQLDSETRNAMMGEFGQQLFVSRPNLICRLIGQAALATIAIAQLWLAGAAVAQGTVRSVHNDWQIRCDSPPGAQSDQCALIQSVTAEDRPNIGLTVIVLRTADKKARLMRVIAPPGVLLPSGLGLKVDNTEIGRAGFVRCVPNGCVAEVILDDSLIGKLRSGQSATFIIFQTPEEGIGFPISLKGFGEGFDKLP
jgi:invasion protein IalB